MKKIKDYLKITLLLLLFSFSLSYGQTAGLSLSWDKEVGCQTLSNEEGHNPKDPILISDIETSQCINVCEKTTVTYTLSNLPPLSSTSWLATGGNITFQNNTTCKVNWGSIGDGNLSFSITNSDGGIITKSICVEKIPLPIANFITGLEEGQDSNYLYVCKGQTINFTNLSTANNGSEINSYHWDFGDNTTSSAQNPQHIFTEEVEYNVSLTVTNLCNCSNTYKITIVPKGEGFDILCPSVVCEGQKVTYSLPFDGMKICQENFNWAVNGGTEVSQAGGNYEVIWNNVDVSGFGTITFNPSGCDLPCLQPTSIRIPVIQSVGTITGDQNICVGGQSIYRLPQWPTTDFQWEIISGNSLATLVQSDQRNEVILNTLEEGFVTIKCTYMNTLLKCGGTAEYNIEIVKPIDFTGTNIICQGGELHFETENGEAVNWNLTGLPFLISTFEPSNQFNYTLPSNFTGNLTISIGNASTDACPSQTKSIRVIAKPIAPGSIVGETIICPEAPYVYSVSDTLPQNDYVWEIEGGNFVGSNTGTQITVVFNAEGPYNLSVFNEAVYPITCRSEASTLEINKKIIAVEIKNPSDNYVRCTNTTDKYSAFITETTDLYIAGEQYIWSIIPPTAGSITSGQNSSEIQVLWNNVTDASTPIIHLVIKECTIAEPFQKTINLVPSPVINITASDNFVCSGTPIEFTVNCSNNVPLDTAIINWNFNGTAFSGAPGELSHPFPFTNISGANSIKTVTAVISNICSQPSNTATVNVTILDAPGASVSIGNGTGNRFCDPESINTYLIATTTSSGVSYQWYKNNTAITGATNSYLQISNTPELGFGVYHVVITGTNNCSTISNLTFVLEDCPDPSDCVLNFDPELNNESYVECNLLYLNGNYNNGPSPFSEYFKIIGPEDYNFEPNNTEILLPKAGIYHVYYRAVYPCDNNPNQTGYKSALEDVVVPYIADFAYAASCANNNSFTVSLIDKSEIFSLVENIEINYGWRPMGSTGAFTPIPSNPFVLPVGNYQFQLIVSGDYDGNAQTPCVKTIDNVHLQSIGDNFIKNDDIFCDYDAVKFSLNVAPLPAETILWTFEEPTPANPSIATVTSTVITPSRVFTIPGTYIVKAKITNNTGCERTYEKQVIIPEPCFSGDVVSNPNPATVCAAEGVVISYNELSVNACTVAQYVWMKGTTEFQTTENNSITVYESGFYWVKVFSENGCEHSSPSRITPAFSTPPALRIKGATSACVNEIVPIEALTNAETVVWTINNDLTFTGPTLLEFGNYPAGVHTLTASVTDAGGCTNTVSHSITVYPQPAMPIVNISLKCNPFQYTLNIVNYNDAYTYNWSNGQTGKYCYATDGGAFSVTVHVGGCAVTNHFDLAKDPSNYTWIFPNGCFSLCRDNHGYLIGPRALFNHWEYNLNDELVTEGENMPTPFNQLNHDGNYTLTLQTEGCSVTTPPLVLDTQGCEDCKFIREHLVKEIKIADLPYCAFTATLFLVSTDTEPQWITLTSPNENFIIVPSSILLEPGSQEINVTLIPINGFVGSTVMVLQYMNSKGEICETIMEFKLPSCDASNFKEAVNATNEIAIEKATITLYPNPAKDQVTIAFSNATPETTVSIYDVTGRLMQTLRSNQAAGTWLVNTSTYQSGLYIVTVSTKNKTTKQYKLIIE